MVPLAPGGQPDIVARLLAQGLSIRTCRRWPSTRCISLLQVPYRSNALSYNDLARGEVHILFDGLANAMPNVRAGRFRLLDEIEALGGFELTGWLGVMAPAGTPVSIVNRMNEEIGWCWLRPRCAGEWSNSACSRRMSRRARSRLSCAANMRATAASSAKPG